MGSELLNRIESYISHRFQYVKLMGHVSESFEVMSGVPQGSHLGPLLFILFMDDVTKEFKSIKIMYADDLKLMCEVRSIADALQLQADLDVLSQWCKTNRLDINVAKCKVMSFFRIQSPCRFRYSIDGVDINRVTEVLDLGVWLDERLTFHRHMDFIVSKAYSMLGFVKRICKQFTNLNALKSIYFAHVRSHLEYASVVWSPHESTYAMKIESIQRKFLIYALRRSIRRDEEYRLPPYETRCELIGIEPLWRRRINLSVMFVFDLIRGRLDAPVLMSKIQRKISVRSLMHEEFFVISCHRTNYGQHEPINKMLRMFNFFSEFYCDMVSRHVFWAKIKSLNLPLSFLDQFGLSPFASHIQ